MLYWSVLWFFNHSRPFPLLSEVYSALTIQTGCEASNVNRLIDSPNLNMQCRPLNHAKVIHGLYERQQYKSQSQAGSSHDVLVHNIRSTFRHLFYKLWWSTEHNARSSSVPCAFNWTVTRFMYNCTNWIDTVVKGGSLIVLLNANSKFELSIITISLLVCINCTSEFVVVIVHLLHFEIFEIIITDRYNGKKKIWHET